MWFYREKSQKICQCWDGQEIPPTWTTTTFRTNPEAYTLYIDSTDLTPSGILPSTTHNRQLGSPKPPRFGRTYNTYTPTQWATQALALNLTKALSRHIITHRQRILTHTEHQRRIHKQTTPSSHTSKPHTTSHRRPFYSLATPHWSQYITCHRSPPQTLPSLVTNSS